MRTLIAAVGVFAFAGQVVAATLQFSTVQGVNGVPLNVVQTGRASGPTIVFIHGLGQSYLSFDRQLKSSLARQFHLVAYDLRGHGNSGKPMGRNAYTDPRKWAGDLQNVLVATHAEHPVIVGWSFGTLVLMDYVRYFGTHALSGIVLVGGWGGLNPMSSVPISPAGRRLLENLNSEQESPNLLENIAAARELSRMLTAKPMPRAWQARATLIEMRVPNQVYGYLHENAFDNTDLVPVIQVPTLLVVGGADGATPDSAARALAARMKDATVVVFRHSGHSPFVEEPAKFNQTLSRFVRDCIAHPSGNAKAPDHEASR